MALDELTQFKGIVVSIKANYYIVEIDFSKLQPFSVDGLILDQNIRLLCTLRRRLTHHGDTIYVGDIVFVESIDWSSHRAVISSLEPRESFLSRPAVANVTDVFVFLSVKNPLLDFEQASSFLLTAEKSSLRVGLILSKSDLVNAAQLNQLIMRITGWGYNAIPVSVENGQGLDTFKSQLKSTKLAVLCGPSGVGKSSFLKYLLPNESIVTGKLSVKLQRGRNTTRNVQLYAIEKDIFIADTPGFSMPNLLISPIKLQTLFPELRCQLKGTICRFRDCLHRDEPGCGIDKNWERYSQYRKLLEEMISSHHSCRVS
ncbi:ribosome small subunit-dependent GTPase A [Prochlorococcus sp. MIT 1307]|uniref:ribosome small subunit-dependent GTPase A n=1 Tax=Prochlorococcus sp. MIT 1307 TaxID=3096219 RepID=UPI002A761F02|nr:ribosome small subunit-dependent GTPase A [Prochlorococcus sp. MIT 1307]